MGSVLLSAPAPISITPFPKKQVSINRANVKITIRVEPNEDNRQLAWACDGGDFYTGSQTDIDGEREKPSHVLWLNSLPIGEYDCKASLWRQGNVQFDVATSFSIVGPDRGEGN